MVVAVPENINFPKAEEEILKLWEKLDVFATCLKQSKHKPRFSFYDGPPFATGLPHYGHILAGTIKDIVTRHAHQSGFHVERRFGWDTHGLPVEYEIDKTLGIKGPQDVAAMGIDKYNAECRKIVMRYSDDWETIVTRLGRWIDFKNDYKTLYPWFMESIWWIFKQLFDKGLVYRGFKVMPFSTACNTPLSNFESGQNYKEVVDPAVMVSFPLEEDPSVSMIAWTTTPWTLPSNLSLCVHPSLEYVKVRDNNTNNVYIMMEARLDALFKKPEEYTVIDKFLGGTLKGTVYQPLFPYFAHMRQQTGAFRVLCDEYVTAESGTGLVHQAPYFGEDDYRVGLANGIITKDMKLICPVDDSGNFTDEVTDFKGMYVKDADKHIIKWLKQHNRLVHQSTTKHSYPFCWRSETPLIYKAVPSWFIRVEHMTDKLLANNQQTYWVPDFVKEKRFANWLRGARDWAVSRNRYWGTPLPLWASDDGEEVVCIGSIAELEQLTGVKVTDLHRETVDGLTIPSRCGKGELRRVSEVFDCWFESGGMPYAQAHYPFENKKEFEDSFPADFIAEGIDQTRGWFYTLLVISTALFDRPPFKNLIVNGLVLASDGQKMSKRKKNYPDPLTVVSLHGADALRLYLIASPVVRAENLRFKQEGVRDVLKDVFLPWYNAYRFLVQNVIRSQKEDGRQFVYSPTEVEVSYNSMDKWILSFTQSLILFVKQEMSAYRLYTVVPRLIKFVDNLTNWYVRSNRRRFKGETGIEDCHKALETLFSVLFDMCVVMAPFTPFLTEHIYQNLRSLLDHEAMKEQDLGSVHYIMQPQAREQLIDATIERKVSRMQAVVELGRVVRDRRTLPTKYPLPELVVVHAEQQCLDDITQLESYVLEELNVRSLTTSTDKDKYGVHLHAEPDHKVLGARLKGDFKPVMAAIQALTDAQIEELMRVGEVTLLGHTLGPDDVRVTYAFEGGASGGGGRYEAHSDGDVLVLLDVTPSEEMLHEGVAREVVNRMQKLRKKAKLLAIDPITVHYDITPKTAELQAIVAKHTEYIEAAIKQPLKPYPVPSSADVIIQEQTDIKGAKLNITIIQRSEGESPASRYVNLTLCSVHPQGGATSSRAVLLLENPHGDVISSADDLLEQVNVVFGLNGVRPKLYKSPKLTDEVSPCATELLALNGSTLYIGITGQPTVVQQGTVEAGPHCSYVNVELVDSAPRNGAKGNVGTVLLENPAGGGAISGTQLSSEVQALFGQRTKKLRLYTCREQRDEVTGATCVATLQGKRAFAFTH
ncbi:PREDICTED: isoleucine--tRNA ligase, cytoplasmic-like [Priapulus caudatus]|uniref:isoleucine--tRNA ligase n=1 Tax=Priapulus caudatus TaxID=37621 RepID=A0ABM1ECY0_PRICU|nr:PREDICTED: isoleucine--tRNA ligase, cytoplasmic-like [Priapulus caudatus]XP_014670051.1 PREDICTED: isoleucine--tRNA ligase, cytoplasmic-like [Priapulus caudatus]